MDMAHLAWDSSDCRERQPTILTIVNMKLTSYKEREVERDLKHKEESEIVEDFLRRRHIRWALKTE